MSETYLPKASLRKIDLDDIQLIRYWRNLDHVRHQMVKTEFVSRDGQRNWFKGLENGKDHYFIFSLDARDIGIATVTKIDLIRKTFEGGIQCGDPKFLKHWINVWACVKIYNYAFFDLSLDISYATILNDNKSAINLNKSLGYKFLSSTDKNVGRYTLTRSDYVVASEKIKRYLKEFAKQPI